MVRNKFIKISFTIVLMVSFLACEKEENSTIEENNNSSFTITVGAFSLDNGVYTALGNELIFDSEEECQTWSRTAGADIHDSNSHLHYNAAADVLYDKNSTTFSWTEYGPEADQATIETTCSNAVSGISKTVNSTSYYKDKPNVYLKITRITEN